MSPSWAPVTQDSGPRSTCCAAIHRSGSASSKGHSPASVPRGATAAGWCPSSTSRSRSSPGATAPPLPGRPCWRRSTRWTRSDGRPARRASPSTGTRADGSPWRAVRTSYQPWRRPCASTSSSVSAISMSGSVWRSWPRDCASPGRSAGSSPATTRRSSQPSSSAGWRARWSVVAPRSTRERT